MNSNGVPIFGPCVAVLPGDQLSFVFPIRQRTVERFDLDQLENAAQVALYDNIPDGWTIDDSDPVKITWGSQVVEGPMGGGMALIHLIAQLKEA